MPVVRVPEPIYNLLKKYAEQENRTVSNAANHLLAGYFSGTPSKTTPSPKNTVDKTLVAHGLESSTLGSQVLPVKPSVGAKSQLCPHGNPWMTCKVASCGIKGRDLGLA